MNEIPTNIGGPDTDLASALTRLPPLERYVLTLVYFHARTQAQIAAQLAIPMPFVARAVARGLQAVASDLASADSQSERRTHVRPVPARLPSLTAAEPPAA
jgi:Sigma-70, region 4